MPLIYRHEKGAPLTIEEVDGNFKELDQRLKTLETQGVDSESMVQIHQKGEVVEILGSKGTNLGRFLLPKIFPKPQGFWKTQQNYEIFDWVQKDRRVYMCMEPHQSQEFEVDLKSGMWQLIFEVPA